MIRQILPDGSQIERSPATHLAALQDLTEIRALLQAAQATPPPGLGSSIEKLATALRMLRHGDGGLALFNGTREETSSLVDLVLTQAGRPTRAPSQLVEGGFHRLQAGRSVLIMDTGAPPPPGRTPAPMPAPCPSSCPSGGTGSSSTAAPRRPP